MEILGYTFVRIGENILGEGLYSVYAPDGRLAVAREAFAAPADMVQWVQARIRKEG